MGAVTQRSPLSRRTFLRVLGTASGAALASSLLGACGSSPTASGERVVNLLWSDVTNMPRAADRRLHERHRHQGQSDHCAVQPAPE